MGNRPDDLRERRKRARQGLVAYGEARAMAPTATALGEATRTPANMPVGRRTPKGVKRWYLVHAPNREQATCDKVKKIISPELLDDAFVMRKERVSKRQGHWVTSVVPMFRDYFFVVTSDAPALDKELAKLSFPVHIEKGDGRYYAPMAQEAQAWYEQMMDSTHTIRTSTGVIADGRLQLQQGPLVGQEARVVKVLRHKRMCVVSVADGASGFSESLPLCIPSKS